MAVKDIIPGHIKNPPRESKPQRRPGDISQDNKNKHYQEYKSIDEWPGDEVNFILSEQFLIQGGKKL